MAKNGSSVKRTDAEIDAQIDGWFAKHGSSPETEPVLAELVEFEFEKRLLILHLSTGRRFVLPMEDVQGLRQATKGQLEDYDLQEGQGIEWPALGVAHSVERLLQGVYGTEGWMRKLRSTNSSCRSGSSRRRIAAT